MADEKPVIRVPAVSVPTMDSYANFEASMGIGTNNSLAQSTYTPELLSMNRQLLDNMYSTSWLVGAAVDYPAEDMTRAGIEIKSEQSNPGEVNIVQGALMDMMVWEKLQEALKWGRLYGGGIAVTMIDGQNMSTPLNIESVTKDKFKGLWVLDRWTAWADTTDLVTEFGPNMGLPKFYQVVAGMGQVTQKIHHSRVLRFDGQPMPYYLRWRLQLWGASILQRINDRIINYDSATAGVAQLLYKAHLRILKVENLRQLIASGGKPFDAMVQNLTMIGRFQSINGLTLLDASDEFEVQSYTFSGLDNVLSQFGEQLCGALEIPGVRLFGTSPGGLGSNGESEIRNYYDNNLKKQENELRRPLTVLLDVMHRSLFGRSPPEGWGFKFNPMWQLSAKEKADTGKVIVDTVVPAFQEGLISQKVAMQELKKSADDTGVFSNITDEDINAADDEIIPPMDPVGAVDPVTGEPLTGAPGDPAGGAGNNPANKD